MWQWFLKLFGWKKEVPALSQASSLDHSPTNISPVLVNLVKARDEALNPILEPHLKEGLEVLLNKVFPEVYKNSLIANKSIILISASDLNAKFEKKNYKDRYSAEEWNTIKTFAIRELKKSGIDIPKDRDEYITCNRENIDKIILTISLDVELSDDNPPPMHIQGIYR